MNLQDIKGRFVTSIDLWADARIDEMVKGNPMLAIPSVYMKRAAHNIISKNKDNLEKQIDNASLFIADENGIIDADTIFADMMQMMKSVKDYRFAFGMIHGKIDDGVISIDLPDNIATAILFGSKRCINFAEEDFIELKELIVNN